MSDRIILETCESTNDVAMELAREGCEHGTVVIAKRQTKGKGRLGRRWESFEGNLTMSLVIRPQLTHETAYRLVLISAYAVIKTLQERGVKAWVKWPNDILIESAGGDWVPKLGPFRKIGGILLEIMSTHGRVDAAIIGIGLNLKKPPETEADRIIPQMGFVELQVTDFVEPLIQALQTLLPAAENEADYLKIVGEMKHQSAFMHKRVEADCGGRIVRGVMVDLLPDGALLIQSDSGVPERIYVGDVTLV